ncbi:MAG: toxic anion resistance protein [Eggerthellaceae bacterium]|nr:toxic anion resistance protein [Eggerthellaceae bacterium]
MADNQTPNFEEIPTPKLTLDPMPGDDTQIVEAVTLETNLANTEKNEALPALDDSLTEEEKLQVEQFSRQIDLSNSQQILMYGAGAQQKMASFSETALEKVRTQDLGEAGELIAGVVVELRNFDAEDEKGFLGFFKRGANKLASLKARYDKAEANVNQIVKALEGHQVTLMRDAAMLDKLYDLNLSYFKELTMYLIAGKKRLEEVRAGQLSELRAKAQASGKTEDAEAVQKLEAACNRFEKKLSDLDLTRTIAMQTAPQIRLVQNNEMLMIEKIQTTLVNTIPLWKSQMVLALGLANNEAALKAQSAVTDMTNELLRKNAEKLKQSTTEVARESERGIVDIETLRAVNDDLIQTFDEVMQIQEEGRLKRAEAEAEMRKMEAELKEKLLEVATK